MKFKVDPNKSLYEQTWWKLLKPTVRLKAIKIWQGTEEKIEKAIQKGEIKIEPGLPQRKPFVVDIPNNNLTHKEH